jgi:hypothetical protein
MAGDFLEWEHSSAALVCLAFILSWDIRASPSGSRISWLESRVNRTLTWKSCLRHSYIFLLFFFFFLSDGTGVWIQGFLLAKLVLYCLSHTSNPFCCGYFWRRGLMNYMPGLALNCDPVFSGSQVARIYRCEPPVPNFIICFCLLVWLVGFCFFFLAVLGLNPGPHTCLVCVCVWLFFCLWTERKHYYIM